MTYATFRVAAEYIARAGTITPHQLAARVVCASDG
jgi:hypothetical protein